MTTIDRPESDAMDLAELADEQLTGLGDMSTEDFRAAGHRVVDVMADYLANVESFPVLPAIAPGSVVDQLPVAPPEAPEDLDAILADYRSLIEPNATAWQHPGVPGLRICASAEAYSSIDKACMTLGLGRASLVRVATNERFELRPDALAAAISEDRAAGRTPVAIVATVGTTSSTSVDPVAAIADVAASERLWLHVDAAYAGAVAIDPDLRAPFAGWDRADSIVVNPHKWLWTPVDASLLLSRHFDVIRDAFSLVPEYLRTVDGIGDGTERNFNEYTPQLGPRFRALN